MNILPALQYWMFTIFMQFVPLNEAEQGSTYYYQSLDSTYTFVIKIDEVSFDDSDALRWEFSSYTNDDTASDFRATIKHNPEEGLHFTSFQFESDEILRHNKIKNIPGKDTLLLMLEEEQNPLFLKTSAEEPELELETGNFSCQKSTYSEEGLSVDIYHNEMFGLLKAAFKFGHHTDDIAFIRIKPQE